MHADVSFLRKKYQGEITTHRQAITALEGKLSLLDEIEADVGAADKPEPTEQIGPKEYAELGLTEAAQAAAIRLSKESGKPVDKTAIGDFMRAHGFVPKGANFLISLDQSLRRLADEKQKKLQTRMEGSRRVYFPPQHPLL